MLETIAVVLVILWFLAVLSGHTLGNAVYLLLAVAFVLILVRLVSGRTA
jgi:uncharacterized protein DUF5670